MEQEYIIYDWVMLNGMKAAVRESYTDADDSFVYIVNDEEYKAEDLKGVPLTPEILEKNGWKWDGQDFVKGAIVLYPEADYFVLDRFGTKIKYVHQLQHLLFGLKLDSNMDVLFPLFLN